MKIFKNNRERAADNQNQASNSNNRCPSIVTWHKAAQPPQAHTVPVIYNGPGTLSSKMPPLSVWDLVPMVPWARRIHSPTDISIGSISEAHGRHKQTDHQVDTVLTAKRRIAAATYQIRLRTSTARWIFPILFNGLGDDPSLGRIRASPNTWFLGPTRVHAASGISIGSVVLAQLTVVTNGQIDTNRRIDCAIHL